MVTFSRSMGGLVVMVSDRQIGNISREHGFFLSPSMPTIFTVISPKDLREIAEKTEEVQA